jgi:amino acid adenylation domain-containing protein
MLMPPTVWNETRTASPDRQTLHGLFEHQVERTPDSIALVFQHEHLSYRDLNQQANRLAQHLSQHGIKPESPVAVCLRRSPRLAVALLAVLKAGGAYVPLDPHYPPARLAYMLEDSGAQIVVTEAPLHDGFHHTGYSSLNLDEIDWARGQHDALPSAATPDNLAYILYTSGSTGQPKGVAIEHRSPADLIAWALETYRPADLAGVLFGTSVCFDLSVFELFVTLAAGGAVILAESVLDLPTLPARDGVTLINTVPSVAAELLRTGGIPSSARVINLAGEPLTRQLAERLYEVATVDRVYNLYGPTEDTTYSTWCLVPRDDSPVTIGRPLPHTSAWVLDANQKLVPVGVPGELYLSGVGLARGYWKRPELTAERFVSLSVENGQPVRLYRTGDRVRWLATRELEYLGRLDHQVKIRGFRIELGEVEAALTQYPAVGQCAVLAREDRPGDKRLVAYLVARPGAELSAAALRAALHQRLPAYMVPSAFVTLPALPLTPNGKIDRRALPAPDFPPTECACEPPQTPVEEAIAAVWCVVLPLKRVGRHDNFFEHGGDSLLAAELLIRLQAAFEVVMSLAAFIRNPTVAGIAELVRQRAAQAGPLNARNDLP